MQIKCTKCRESLPYMPGYDKTKWIEPHKCKEETVVMRCPCCAENRPCNIVPTPIYKCTDCGTVFDGEQSREG